MCAIFVIDSSFSIGSDLFNEAITFVEDVADIVFDNAPYAALGAMSYSDGAIYNSAMTTIPSDFKTGLSSMTWLMDSTETHSALNLATSEILSHG